MREDGPGLTEMGACVSPDDSPRAQGLTRKLAAGGPGPPELSARGILVGDVGEATGAVGRPL